jgi:hypothetical protein
MRPLGGVAMATILAIGFLFVWFFALLTAITIYNNTCDPWSPEDIGTVPDELLVLTDGTPVLSPRSWGEYGRTYRALDGKRLKSSNPEEMDGCYLVGPNQPKDTSTPLNWTGRFVQLVDGHPELPQTFSKKLRGTHWYFVRDGVDASHGYFANCGRDPGYIGRNGFQCDKPSLEQQFAINTRDPLLAASRLGNNHSSPMAFSVVLRGINTGLQQGAFGLLTEDGLMQIDLETRSVKRLCSEKATCAELEIVGMSSRLALARHEAKPPEFRILFRTSDRVRRLTLDGKEEAAYILPKELRDRNFVWYGMPNGNILACASETLPIQSNADCELFWFTKAGNVLRREQFHPEKPKLKKEQDWTDNLGISVAMPSAGIMTAMTVWDPEIAPKRQDCSGFWTARYEALCSVWQLLAATGLIGLISALLCYRRQRKFGQTGTWGWMTFVFLFGLPGYVGYLTHRSWPTRLACPHCGKRVPRDRATCLKCGREFPLPSPKGIEVFA